MAPTKEPELLWCVASPISVVLLSLSLLILELEMKFL